MTNEEAKKMLKAKLDCLTYETAGCNYDCNNHLCDGCNLNYEQGNMGEQKEALEMAIQALEQEPCEDCISREALRQSLQFHRNFFASSYGSYQYITPKDKVRVDEIDNCIARVVNAPSVTPKFTDNEIQKMQELEQAQFEKAYELGRAEMQPCEDAISREAVIDIINFEDKWLYDANGHNANTKIAFSGLRSRVKALLSVTSEAESEAK